MVSRKRIRGTTLVELLLATVFLGLCVGGMLGSIAGARTRADIAKWQTVALTYAESEIAKARSEAMKGTLATGVTETKATDANMKSGLTITRSVALESGTTDVYKVTVTVSYERDTSTRRVTDQIKLSTNVRMPDV